MDEKKYVIIGIIKAAKLWHTLVLYEKVGTDTPVLTRVRHRDLAHPIDAKALLEFDQVTQSHYEANPEAGMMTKAEANAIMDAEYPVASTMVSGIWKYYIPTIERR